MARPTTCSAHANERFAERWPKEAQRRALEDLLHHAEFVARESEEQEIWRIDNDALLYLHNDADLLLVVDGEGCVRTVLPPGTVWRTQR